MGFYVYKGCGSNTRHTSKLFYERILLRFGYSRNFQLTQIEFCSQINFGAGWFFWAHIISTWTRRHEESLHSNMPERIFSHIFSRHLRFTRPFLHPSYYKKNRCKQPLSQLARADYKRRTHVAPAVICSHEGAQVPKSYGSVGSQRC